MIIVISVITGRDELPLSLTLQNFSPESIKDFTLRMPLVSMRELIHSQAISLFQSLAS